MADKKIKLKKFHVKVKFKTTTFFPSTNKIILLFHQLQNCKK